MSRIDDNTAVELLIKLCGQLLSKCFQYLFKLINGDHDIFPFRCILTYYISQYYLVRKRPFLFDMCLDIYQV